MTKPVRRGTEGKPPPRAPANIVLGVARVATGRADGLTHFGGSAQTFLASLAPLVAFPLVFDGLMLVQGPVLPALTELLAALCALLTPAVLSFEFARWWGREAEWWRYITAFNWCQWAIPVAVAILLTLAGIALGLGAPKQAAGLGAACGLMVYGLWLHWFLARHGLRLSRLRAVLMVVCVNFGTAVLVFGPQLAPLLGQIGGQD
jgi:hypothetical protein